MTKEHKVFAGGEPLSGLDTQTAALILVSNYAKPVCVEQGGWCHDGDPIGTHLTHALQWLEEAGMIERVRPVQATTPVHLTHRGRAILRKLFPKSDLILP